MKRPIDIFIASLLILFSVNAGAATHYVSLNNPIPNAPFTSWATAATNIQDAIDAADAGDFVLVTNGVYNTGGQTNGTSWLTNRVVVNKPLTVQSVNGPGTTTIEGYQVPGTIVGNSAVRGVYVTNGAALIGFTIANGANRGDGTQVAEQGAGVFCEGSDAVISNCVIVGNFATGYGQAGGGVCSGSLFNCVLAGNKASGGAGAWNSALYNCTIISNTATSSGGGVLGNTFANLNGSVLENCVVAFNSAPGGGGFSGLGTLNNCQLLSNTASTGNGGGAGGGVLSNCVVAGNQALGTSGNTGKGGGIYSSSLISCVVSNNSAQRTGGGAEGGSLTNCNIRANTSLTGGGVNGSALWNCQVTENTADASGGGASSTVLVNSLLSDNSALISGGGAYFSDMTNCLVTGNRAESAGGVLGGTCKNSIVYYNFAATNPNYLSNTMNFCCTTPLPLAGNGNLTGPPQLTDQFHLSAASPCLASGDGSATFGTDLDGEAWNSPPAIGCDEFYPETATGALSVVIVVEQNDSSAGFATGIEGMLRARISGNAGSNYWDFGDGFSATNQAYTTHTWTLAGLYTVRVWVFNSDHPAGVVAERLIQIFDQPVHYVYASNPNPVAPYLSWETAATNIQDAIDVAFGGSSILVSNGVYSQGGRVAFGNLSNRVVVTEPVPVRSVNGPQYTIIQGYQVPGTTNGDTAIRCVVLANGASLSGFTLTNGATFTFGTTLGKTIQDFSGGGVCCLSTNEVVTNCIVTGNSAYEWAAGAYSGTFNNCTLSGNINYNGSPFGGGGAAFSTMNDCLVSGNQANSGGGVHSAVMNRCVLASNSMSGAQSSTLNNCTILGNSGGGVINCTLINCILTNNSATSGSVAGGATSSTLRDCLVINNSGVSGGGLVGSTATNCLIRENKATQLGGGVSGSTLNNCFVSSNTAPAGGGVGGGSRLTNCVIAYNSAVNHGGGAYSGPYLVNCLLTGNSSAYGGGADTCTIIGCTVSSNTASVRGGGLFQGTAANSIIYFNTAPSEANIGLATATLRNCCTIPFVPGYVGPGAGDFTNAPRFVDQFGGNFRLQTNSPCIGTGNNGNVSTSTDLDGRPRIVGGTVDVGAYEFQGVGFGEFIAWLQSFGFPTDGSADFSDPDHDGMNNWQEWRSGTDPLDFASALRMSAPVVNSSGVLLKWQSISGVTYYLMRSTTLSPQPLFLDLQSNLVGNAGETTFVDTNPPTSSLTLYRVGVQ